MTTDKQLRANRKNAKKSTGPNTPEGKARSSKNALKHGLLARDAVLPGEDPADFDRQLTALEDWALPRNPLEHEICRQIVDAQWRMQRLSRIETAIITVDINDVLRGDRVKGAAAPEPGREGDNKLLGRAMLIGGAQSLVQLSRYDAHLTRRFYRSVKLLTEIRRDQRKARAALDKSGDAGFDVYSTVGPTGLQHRYVPAKSPIQTVINRAANVTTNRAAPNRAANVSERCQTNPDNSNKGGGPDATDDRTPKHLDASTTAPTQQTTAETPSTINTKAPPPPR